MTPTAWGAHPDVRPDVPWRGQVVVIFPAGGHAEQPEQAAGAGR
jgi:hypothetical protein